MSFRISADKGQQHDLCSLQPGQLVRVQTLMTVLAHSSRLKGAIYSFLYSLEIVCSEGITEPCTSRTSMATGRQDHSMNDTSRNDYIIEPSQILVLAAPKATVYVFHLVLDTSRNGNARRTTALISFRSNNLIVMCSQLHAQLCPGIEVVRRGNSTAYSF